MNGGGITALHRGALLLALVAAGATLLSAEDALPTMWGGVEVELAGGLRGSDGLLYIVGVTGSFGDHARNALAMKYDGESFAPITTGAGGEADIWSWSGGAIDICDGAVTPAGRLYFAGCTGYDSFDDECYGDTLLLRLDVNAGTLDWARIVDTTNAGDDDHTDGMAVDGAGNLLLAGALGGPDRDTLLVKLDADGALQWARSWDGGFDDSFNGVAVGTDDAIYAAGTIADATARVSALLLKYGADGSLSWARSWRDDANLFGEDDAIDVAAHPDGGVVLSGSSHALGDPQDAFLLRFDSGGTLLWSAIWESAADRDVGADNLLVDAAGFTHVGGSAEQLDPDAPEVGLLLGVDNAGVFRFARGYHPVSDVGDLPSFFTTMVDDGPRRFVATGVSGDRYGKLLPVAGSVIDPIDAVGTPIGSSSSVATLSYLTLGNASSASSCALADPPEPSCGALDAMVLELDRTCIDLAATGCAGGPGCLALAGGYCPPATPVSERYQLIEGELAALSFAAGSVDLGTVRCLGGTIDENRLLDLGPTPAPGTGAFYLTRDVLSQADFGAASSGQRRDRVVVAGSCP